MLSAATGFSRSHDPVTAGREAVGGALEGLGRTPRLLVLFATAGYEQEPLVGAIREAAGPVPLVGCSGEGVIVGGDSDESNFAVGIMALWSPGLVVRRGFVPDLHRDPPGAGRAVVRAAAPGPASRALLVFADGVHINLDGLVAGLTEGLPAGLPVLGGAAADAWTLERTFQYVDGVHDGGVGWALLEGDLRVDWTLSHGCVPIGCQRTVTRIEGNALYEIDGRPALEVIGEYLVDSQRASWERAVVNLALGFRAPADFAGADDPYDYVITHVAPTPDAAALGCVIIPREVAPGTPVWIMRRDHERIREGNDRMVQRLLARREGRRPDAVLMIDCAGRGKACFREPQKRELLARLRQGLGAEVPLLGFYSYGEFCPMGATTCGHCYTAVLTALYGEP